MKCQLQLTSFVNFISTSGGFITRIKVSSTNITQIDVRHRLLLELMLMFGETWIDKVALRLVCDLFWIIYKNFIKSAIKAGLLS